MNILAIFYTDYPSFNYILNEEQLLIAKNLRGEALQRKLAELIN